MLPSPLLKEIFGQLEERQYAVGEKLIVQGAAGDGLFILLSGTAQATLRSDEDHQIARFQPGDVIGEMALVTREPRTADVIAEAPVRALFLPIAAFDQLASRNLVLCVVLTELVAGRLGQAARDGLGGKVIEGYKIEQCIGRGGMAIVYKAIESVSGRTVALKMMNHRLVYEPDALVLFHHEAELMQTLRHENIAALERLFPAFNTYFLVMEYCDGPDLGRLVSKHGRLPESQVRRILGQLAAALDHMHERRLIHRDLKPGNVMLTRAGVVKLTDFGVATAEVGHSDETRMASIGLTGTPIYMPPEQLSNQPLDARADIYAVGCIAYSLLTGTHLFRGANLIELIQEKFALRLPPAKELAGGISQKLHDFISRAVRTERDERPRSLAPLMEWAGPVDTEWLQ
jgi:serine/threonine protein kinase